MRKVLAQHLLGSSLSKNVLENKFDNIFFKFLNRIDIDIFNSNNKVSLWLRVTLVNYKSYEKHCRSHEIIKYTF